MKMNDMGLNDIQYLYEFLFWFVTFYSQKSLHKPEVRLIYGYSVAVFNLIAQLFFSLSSIREPEFYGCFCLWVFTYYGSSGNAYIGSFE